MLLVAFSQRHDKANSTIMSSMWRRMCNGLPANFIFKTCRNMWSLKTVSWQVCPSVSTRIFNDERNISKCEKTGARQWLLAFSLFLLRLLVLFLHTMLQSHERMEIGIACVVQQALQCSCMVWLQHCPTTSHQQWYDKGSHASSSSWCFSKHFFCCLLDWQLLDSTSEQCEKTVRFNCVVDHMTERPVFWVQCLILETHWKQNWHTACECHVFTQIVGSVGQKMQMHAKERSGTTMLCCGVHLNKHNCCLKQNNLVMTSSHEGQKGWMLVLQHCSKEKQSVTTFEHTLWDLLETDLSV